MVTIFMVWLALSCFGANLKSAIAKEEYHLKTRDKLFKVLDDSMTEERITTMLSVIGLVYNIFFITFFIVSAIQINNIVATIFAGLLSTLSFVTLSKAKKFVIDSTVKYNVIDNIISALYVGYCLFYLSFVAAQYGLFVKILIVILTIISASKAIKSLNKLLNEEEKI